MPVKSGFATNGPNWGGRRVGGKWARGGRGDLGQAGRRRRRTVQAGEDQRVCFCDGGDRLSSELRTDLIPSLPPGCALRVASLRWGAVSRFSAVFLVPFAASDGSVFRVRTQLYAKSTLPASLTVFPSLSTATSLTANFHTRLSPSVIHDRDTRLFGFKKK